jgi:hypothetical protein
MERLPAGMHHGIDLSHSCGARPGVSLYTVIAGLTHAMSLLHS